jgi:hypothetical protein
MSTLTASLPADRTPDATPPRRNAPSASSQSMPGKKAVWTGRVLTGLATLFLLVDAGFKFATTPEAIEATRELGWPANVIPVLGVMELVCLALYLVPRTAVLGAVLWTGYLGGAIATHLRVGNPLLTHTLFPIYVAALIWGGLWLRDRRLRGLLSR